MRKRSKEQRFLIPGVGNCMKIWSWCVVCALAAMTARAATLFGVGPDPSTFVPDQLDLIVTPGSVSNVGTLGDGTLSFNGGLTFGLGGALYGIANDSTGASSFYQINTSNAGTTLVGSAGGLGDGFLGGLAWDTANSTSYAAVEDTSGNTTLWSISSGGTATNLGQSLGTDFTGLTYDASNGLFYGIGNDSFGNSSLYSFSLGGPVTLVAALGTDYGGITYDSGINAFWLIGNYDNAASQLYQVTTAGVLSSPLMTLGDGFIELAAPSGVPEPGTGVVVGAVLLIGGGLLKLRRRKL
jgi:hypothetical protein